MSLKILQHVSDNLNEVTVGVKENIPRSLLGNIVINKYVLVAWLFGMMSLYASHEGGKSGRAFPKT